MLRNALFSWHAHLLAWGISKQRLARIRDQINRDRTTMLPGVEAVHYRPLRHGEVAGTALYALKPPLSDYRLYPMRRESIDRATGEITISTTGRFKQRKGELRPADLVHMARVLEDKWLDQLAFTAGEGEELLAAIAGCGYRKGSGCAEPRHFSRCPLSSRPLRMCTARVDGAVWPGEHREPPALREGDLRPAAFGCTASWMHLEPNGTADRGLIREDASALRIGAPLEPVRRSRPAAPEGDGTLGRQIYSELERKILLGEWLPGHRVTLRTLALLLETSMQPVREAIGRLAAASALEATPNRAFRIPILSRPEADDIWSMRMLLEGEASARLAQRNDTAALEAVAAATDAFRSISFGHDVRATMEVIIRWNLALVEASGSSLLSDTITRLYLRYAPFLAHALSVAAPHDEEFLQFTVHIQDELVHAIRAGDVAAARHLRCADLRSFQRYLYGRIGWSPS